MDGMGAVGGGDGQEMQAVELRMLKESQDLMKQQSAALLEALPEAAPMSPNPPGVGGRVNIRA